MPLPLTILPGLMCDGRMFAAQRTDLGALVIDGFYDGADRIEAMARHVLTRMPPLSILLGHSMGARVAFELWRTAPHRIAGLILADTGVDTIRPGEADKRYALLALGREQGIGALADAWLPPMIGVSNQQDAALYATLQDMVNDAGIDIFAAQIEALLNRPALGDLLPTISCPTLVMVGQDDQWSPVAQHAAFATRIPGATLHVVEGAGHMAPAERPAAFNAAISEWITTNFQSDK